MIDSTSMIMRDSRLHYNFALERGGTFDIQRESLTSKEKEILITESEIIGSYAQYQGGKFYVDNEKAGLSIVNCKIQNTTARDF